METAELVVSHPADLRKAVVRVTTRERGVIPGCVPAVHVWDQMEWHRNEESKGWFGPKEARSKQWRSL